MNRRDWMILLAITLLAAALRLYQLGEVPPGFQFDEAFNANDADQVLAGNRPLFLPANGGREALYTYWQVVLSALLGLNVYTLRLASAIMGILAIPASYLLCRVILQQDGQKIAAFTSLTLAISLWHMHFSRYGIRVIMMPVILSAIFTFFWLGTQSKSHATRFIGYLISGLLTGLSVWTHPAGRIVPFALILYVIWLCLRHPENRRLSWKSPFSGLILTGIAAFLVFLPLGLEFYRHPDFFWGHASEISIFAQRVSEGAPYQILLHNLGRVLGMFSISGDQDWTHNLSQRPVFDLLLSIPFYIGLIVWGNKIFRGWNERENDDVDGLALLALWFLVMLLPSVLSEAAPNYSRTLPSLPAAFVAVGLGLNWLLSAYTPVRILIVSAILLFSTGSTLYDYFVRFAQTSVAYYVYDTDKLDSLDHLQPFTQDYQVYLSQLWGEKHATVLFLRGQMGIQSLDIADTIVLPPPGQGAVYAFPQEQQKRAQQIAARWPGEAIVEEVLDPHGRLLLANAILSPAAVSHWPLGYEAIQPLEAQFFDSPTLVGIQLEEDSSDIVLVWRHDEHTYRDLTTFIHLLDVEGNQVGQADKQPGNGSYRTPYWTIGERVIERYPTMFSDPCAGGEDVRILVGWYEWLGNNRRMARTNGPGDTALAGEMTVPLISYPRSQLQPAMLLELSPMDGLTLVGYDQREQEFQASAPLTLNLYWQGNSTFNDEVVQLTLQGEESYPLWEDALVPNGVWDEDEVICRRLRLRLPSEISPGDYDLTLSVDSQQIQLNPLTLAESTRIFEAPPLHRPIQAQLGDSIALLGLVDLPTMVDDTQLEVTLAWQATSIPAESYQVFIHLLDEQGQIIAQSDAVPGSGYATNRWIQGEVVLDRHMLQLSETLTGAYRLAAGLYEPVSGQRLPAVNKDRQQQVDDRVDLGEVQRLK